MKRFTAVLMVWCFVAGCDRGSVSYEAVSRCYPVGACPASMLSQGITAAAGDASRGKGMFEMACASCHGKNGKGTVQAPGIDFTTAVWQSKYRDGQIASIIKAGRPPKMPPVNLSDEELRDIIAYVRTLKVKAPKKKISY